MPMKSREWSLVRGGYSADNYYYARPGAFTQG
jgi:hypothetical protein